MKVAVIAPPYPLEEAPAPPLGTSYVAAAFESAGAEVEIFDFIVTQYTPEKLRKRLEAFRPDVVGAGSVTLNFPGAAEILQTVKQCDPGIVTVMGGPHVSFDAVNTLQAYPGIDLIVRGEGERTIAELTAAKFRKSALSGIRGIAYRSNGELCMTEPRELMGNLDTLPLPARHLLPLTRYQAMGYPISMITSRGCPYRCIFCLGRQMVGSKVRQRRTDAVVEEIQDILSYGFDRINIADDLFVSDKRKVKDVCAEIKNRDLKFAWSAFARVNTVDQETLDTMRAAGCDAISFGVESGNQEILDRAQKRITLDQVRKAIAMCKEADLIVHASFIAGLPGESPESLKRSREFAESLGVDYGFHLLAPFPGTTVREKAADYNMEILTQDWTRYDANHAIVKTPTLAPEGILEFARICDEEIQEKWQKKLQGYKDGTNIPWDNLLVEGHYRTQLIYKLLSRDLIEEEGAFSGARSQEETVLPLCSRIENKTQAGMELIEKTIRDFIKKDYIRTKPDGDGLAWHWRRNCKQ